MAGFLVIEPQNLEATVSTFKMIPGAGDVQGFEHFDADGLPCDDGKYQLIRITGNSQMCEFFARNQGYARIIKAIHE